MNDSTGANEEFEWICLDMDEESGDCRKRSEAYTY